LTRALWLPIRRSHPRFRSIANDDEESIALRRNHDVEVHRSMCGSERAFACSRSCRSMRSFEALFAGKKVKDLGTRVRMDLLRNLSLHLGAEIGLVDVQHVTCRGRNIGNRSNLRDERATGRP